MISAELIAKKRPAGALLKMQLRNLYHWHRGVPWVPREEQSSSAFLSIGKVTRGGRLPHTKRRCTLELPRAVGVTGSLPRDLIPLQDRLARTPNDQADGLWSKERAAG
jgi:hypothetical protein